jgi:ATP-dependent protease ClpP protease subunit
MDKILSGLFFSQKAPEPEQVTLPNTIVIDTSVKTGYFSMDYINKSVYNKFVKDYSRYSPNDHLTLNITSLGGEIFYILMIANIINKHKGIITATITKYCTGGAMLIALSCNNILMTDSACIGYMHFYNNFVPTDFCHLMIKAAETNPIIPEYIQTGATMLNESLSVGRQEIERQMYKLLEKNYDRETAMKIADFFYLNPLNTGQIFKEDVPSFLNVTYDGERDNMNNSLDGTDDISVD